MMNQEQVPRAVLVPVDGSSCSERALELATLLARVLRSKLEILRVSQVPPTYEKGLPVYSEVAAEVASDRDELRALPISEGVTYEKHHRIGTPAAEILAFAEQQNVQLIVMGTHGRTGLKRLLYGSVAEHVMRHATCPVVTYREQNATSDSSSPTQR